jgi:hypothetical protein
MLHSEKFFSVVSFIFGAVAGLSALVRGGRAWWQRAAVAPHVASSPRATRRRPPCGLKLQSLPLTHTQIADTQFTYIVDF